MLMLLGARDKDQAHAAEVLDSAWAAQLLGTRMLDTAAVLHRVLEA
jgi:hypothetical protein